MPIYSDILRFFSEAQFLQLQEMGKLIKIF